MEIKLEALIIISIILIFLVWAIWFRWSTKRLWKKYDPKDDKGKKGDESIVGEREDTEVGIGESVVPEPIGSTGSNILETASSLLSDTHSKRLRRTFGKRRKR